MTYDPTEKELSTLNEGRLMRAESDIIIPLLTKQREAAVSKVIYHFKAHELEKLPAAAAELAAIEDMRAAIANRIKKAEHIERKVYGKDAK